MRIRVRWVLANLWIGFAYNPKSRTAFLQFLPTITIIFERRPRPGLVVVPEGALAEDPWRR